MLNSLGSFRLSILRPGGEGQWVVAALRHRASLEELTWPGEPLASGCLAASLKEESKETQSVSAQLQLDQGCQV